MSLVESDYALEWMRNPWADVDASGRWLLDLAASFGAEVIHLNGYSHANLPWAKPVVVTAHSCVYSWWRAVHGGEPGAEWAEYKRRVTAGLAACNVMVAPSAYMSGAVQREYGIAAEKIRVIHNFSGASQSAVQDKQRFILAAGRIWDAAKNLNLLEQIAPKVDWEIRVAGSERGPESVTIAAKSIRALGALPHPELLNEMERAGIFAHPALYEPFGLAVLEAARARCCLVLADIPSLRELWEGAAIFVDPRDVDGWTFELNELIGNAVKRDGLGERAYSHARKYQASSALNEYWSVYRALDSERAKKDVAA